MQASTASPVTNITSNSTAVTKSQEQILIQSSGAMIAVIVVGIILILAVLLFILKTYNRRTHASRVLGLRGSKPRPKTSQSTSQSNVPLGPVGVDGLPPPGPELSSLEERRAERASTTSSSTAATVHEQPSVENT
ncbi:noncompact myelin-associated protein isoform X1 [Salarias fasciatus]|uniref:noncompact myelin-associated protein isoform X1 n=1 Tax=Salarias fasciatus TaxID=181472 RepID=UPI001176822A|nr:noncompact myelin-associated protein isoform X1 [Salarias fasciatus]